MVPARFFSLISLLIARTALSGQKGTRDEANSSSKPQAAAEPGSWQGRPAESWGAGWGPRRQRRSSHLPTLVVHEQVPDVALSPVGDLQPVGVPYLLCLEGGVQVLDADDSFGAFTLKERTRVTSHHLHSGLNTNG